MSQIKLIVMLEKGDDLSRSLEDVIKSFLMDKAVSETDHPKIKNPDDPATPGQLAVLNKHKISFLSGISKSEASELIKKSMEGN